MKISKVGIIGPGSIGLLLASKIQKAGFAVILIDRKAERAANLNNKGILLDEETSMNFNIPVISGFDNIDGINLMIVCVKAYNTGDVALALQHSSYEGPVLTLQNGFGNADTIGKIYKKGSIIAGTTSEGANLISEGHVKHAGRGKTSFGFALKRNMDDEILKDAAAIFNNAGLDTEISNDVDGLIWGKVLVNAGINALTAIFNVPNGRLLEIEEARGIMKNLITEAWELLQIMDIKLPFDDPVKKTEDVCRLTASNLSSMNRDMSSGRRTEIDFINGAIVREGKRMGISCPYNETISGIILALEKIKMKPV